MSDSLSATQGRAMQRIAGALRARTEAELVVLADGGGNLLVQAPERDVHDVASMAALAAGAFAATRELARLTGEDGFRSVAHEGDETGLFVQSVDADTLVVVVFRKPVALGLVKLYTRRAVAELLAWRRPATPEELAHDDHTFELSDTADAIFALPMPVPEEPLAARRTG